MEIFLYITVIFVLFVSFGFCFLFIKLISLIGENTKMKEYIKRASNEINRARYGNFQIQLDAKKDKLGLYRNLNSLFESMADRDLVINEYREKEKENYNLKEEFIAALTHDLKVPIIAQDKTYDLLLNKKFGALSEVQGEVILKLKESNSDLKEMVNSILETYKIENTGIELKIEKNIEVESFLKSIIESLKSLIDHGNKTINLIIDTKSFTADFDPFLIKRVVNNLIMNAISHSKTTDGIDIHLNKTGDYFSIDVIDYGDGVDEDEIQNIFKKYYSITNKNSRISSGLGLYLSNKIVKKHKGQIEVESKKKEGSIFRIILPSKAEQ